ncbi:hypothetical protein V1478_012993 [Vespula squamosa]|uniref:Uncharacterized protein n=1 Tax=Vespula squamosa TaxID=30214 RepID=A0ABD2A9K1_VESSQ
MSVRGHIGGTFKKRSVDDPREINRERIDEGRKIMWLPDIFPIHLELMYRRYYGDASKAFPPFHERVANERPLRCTKDLKPTTTTTTTTSTTTTTTTTTTRFLFFLHSTLERSI